MSSESLPQHQDSDPDPEIGLTQEQRDSDKGNKARLILDLLQKTARPALVSEEEVVDIQREELEEERRKWERDVGWLQQGRRLERMMIKVCGDPLSVNLETLPAEERQDLEQLLTGFFEVSEDGQRLLLRLEMQPPLGAGTISPPGLTVRCIREVAEVPKKNIAVLTYFELPESEERDRRRRGGHVRSLVAAKGSGHLRGVLGVRPSEIDEGSALIVTIYPGPPEEPISQHNAIGSRLKIGSELGITLPPVKFGEPVGHGGYGAWAFASVDYDLKALIGTGFQTDPSFGFDWELLNYNLQIVDRATLERIEND